MTNLKDQEELLKVIGEKLERKTEAYVIGGSAMLYYGAKVVTKDIDIVFGHKKDRDSVLEILKKLGFQERSARLIYFKKGDMPILLQRGEDRIDLFFDKVVDFKFTETIKQRATGSYEYGNLIVKVISPEDIIILKCATERAGDRLDAASLMKMKNIDWDIIINEAMIQMEIIGDIIPLCLYEFMCELKEDLKADIDQKIIDKLGDLTEKVIKEKLDSEDTVKVTKFRSGK